MRLLYLICSIILALLILIISVAQFGASCSWFLIGTGAKPVFVLLMIAILGAAAGACFILFAVAPKEGGTSGMDDDVDS